jgi:hypothetical protein
MRRLLFILAAALLLPATLGAQPKTVHLPLGTEGPTAWRPVRDGISITGSGGGLTASYKVVTGQPAGAALAVPPGTLAGLRSLRLKLHGTRNAQVMVFLRDAMGVAYAFPSVPVQVGDAREAEIFASDLSYLGQASHAPDPGSFDPANAVMISLVDISGYMGPETPETAWTLESLEGVVQ